MAHIKFQRTIGSETSCIGIGLHTGVESKITFKPAPENYGIRYKRIDIEDEQKPNEGIQSNMPNVFFA